MSVFPKQNVDMWKRLSTSCDDIHINWKNVAWMKGTLKWLKLKYSPSDIKSLVGMIYKGLKVKNKLIFAFMKALCVATNHQWYSDWEVSFFICLWWLFLHFNLRNVWFLLPLFQAVLFFSNNKLYFIFIYRSELRILIIWQLLLNLTQSYIP